MWGWEHDVMVGVHDVHDVHDVHNVHCLYWYCQGHTIRQ